jgi:hypothetical protein
MQKVHGRLRRLLLWGAIRGCRQKPSTPHHIRSNRVAPRELTVGALAVRDATVCRAFSAGLSRHLLLVTRTVVV